MRRESSTWLANYTQLNSGVDINAERTGAGIGFPVNTQEIRVIDFVPIFDRIVIIWVQTNDTDVDALIKH